MRNTQCVITNILPTVRNPHNRFVCNKRKLKKPKLRIQTSTPTIQGQCCVDELVRDIFVRFSSSPTCTICGQETQTLILIAPTWAHQPWYTTLLKLSLHPHEKLPNYPNSHTQQGQSETSQSSTAQSCNLAPEVIDFGYLNLCIIDKCMTVLKEARRPTTAACYAAKWKRIVHYSTTQHINPSSPTEQVICYLLHLQKSQLAYISIRLHLAAIAAYLQNRKHQSLFHIPVIKAFNGRIKKSFHHVHL